MKNEVKWVPVSSGVILRSIFRPVFFNIFVYDVDDGKEYILSQLADDKNITGRRG